MKSSNDLTPVFTHGKQWFSWLTGFHMNGKLVSNR